MTRMRDEQMTVCTWHVMILVQQDAVPALQTWRGSRYAAEVKCLQAHSAVSGL